MEDDVATKFKVNQHNLKDFYHAQLKEKGFNDEAPDTLIIWELFTDGLFNWPMDKFFEPLNFLIETGYGKHKAFWISFAQQFEFSDEYNGNLFRVSPCLTYPRRSFPNFGHHQWFIQTKEEFNEALNYPGFRRVLKTDPVSVEHDYDFG